MALNLMFTREFLRLWHLASILTMIRYVWSWGAKRTFGRDRYRSESDPSATLAAKFAVMHNAAIFLHDVW